MHVSEKVSGMNVLIKKGSHETFSENPCLGKKVSAMNVLKKKASGINVLKTIAPGMIPECVEKKSFWNECV